MTQKENLQKLIATKQRRLQFLQEKEAKFGISTPPETLIEIEDTEEKIARLEAQLAAIKESPPPSSGNPEAGADSAKNAYPEDPAKLQHSIFISYSHQDEAWKDRLMGHLRVLQLEGAFDVWDDRQIAVGETWYPAIEQAINEASLAILLVSVNFLTSKFIRSEEIPRFFKRRAEEGMRIYPIIVKPCPWKGVDWLSSIQVRPKDGTPLTSGDDYAVDEVLSNIALEIESLLRTQPVKKLVPSTPSSPPVQPADSGANFSKEEGITAMTFKQKSVLVQALLACPTMAARHSRDTVINELPEHVKSNIQRNSSDRVDLMNLITTCLNYPGSLEELIEIVRFYEGESSSMQKVDQLLN